ncbi:hypothetical protein OIU79_023600 [Salix purpurea]|uniref:Uncharacterized protein n=1 Tax=Salix purpurea TaxID=77065 RepID=A0A9Q1A933_SALPP|nr:hypothetical protein OIU79_023600 [Salix purpurea]
MATPKPTKINQPKENPKTKPPKETHNPPKTKQPENTHTESSAKTISWADRVKGVNGKTINEVPSAGALLETAAGLGDTQVKPSHEIGQVSAASEGAVQETASAKSIHSLHADLSERHAAADMFQISNQRSVESRGKDKLVGPSCKEMQPGKASSKPTLFAGPSQEPTKPAKTQSESSKTEASREQIPDGIAKKPIKQAKAHSESSMSSRPEASHEPTQAGLPKKPDKGKATFHGLESSEGAESSGKGILPKGNATTMASYIDQPCDSEEDLEVDSRQAHSDQNEEETSSLPFTTVKMKKGGKKRHKEARRL